MSAVRMFFGSAFTLVPFGMVVILCSDLLFRFGALV